MNRLAWGGSVSTFFRKRAIEIGQEIRIDPSYLMACMAFETGETFSPSIRNSAGSGSVGLIQFMPSTAASFGLTVEEMAAMTAEEQLRWVERYFRPWTGRLHDLGDVYGAILWPAMIGKPPSWPVFRKDDAHCPKLYLENRGLDFNKDGEIAKAEIVARVQKELDRGFEPGNVWVFV